MQKTSPLLCHPIMISANTFLPSLTDSSRCQILYFPQASHSFNRNSNYLYTENEVLFSQLLQQEAAGYSYLSKHLPTCFFLWSSNGKGFLEIASLTASLSFFCSLRYFLAALFCLYCLFFNLLSSFIWLVLSNLRKLGTRFVFFL